MLDRFLRTRGKDRATAVSDVNKFLKYRGTPSHEDAVGLVHLSRPNEEAVEGSGFEAHFSSPAEKHALIARFFQTLATHRPLILWLDELHHSPESQALAKHLLNAVTQFPVLILATVQAEEVIEGSDMDARLRSLMAHDLASEIDLRPLDRQGQVTLIEEILGLEPVLAARVESQSGGNPQFAVQLVSTWVQRGILVPGPRGFTLAADSDQSIPESMLAIWSDRLEEVLSQHSEASAFAIELGAILGNEVQRGEWLEALRAAELPIPTALMSDLLRLRLIVTDNQRSDWSFIHALFREAVLERVHRHKRKTRWSSLCADVVTANAHSVTRKARLLVAADRTEEALMPLKNAVASEIAVGEWGRAHELRDLRKSILENFAVDPEGAHALSTEVTELMFVSRKERTAILEGRGKNLISWAEELEQWDAVTQLRMSTATGHLHAGRGERARELMIETLEVARRHHLPDTVEVLNRLCFLCIRTGDVAGAASFAREAGLTAEAWGNTIGVANAYTMMARANWQRGQIDDAKFYLNEAIIRYERTGCRRGLAEAWNTRGELARAANNLEAAEVAYLEADARFESCGSPAAAFAKLNLGSTYIMGGKFSRAKHILDALEETLKTSDQPAVVAVTQLARVNCFIDLKDWERVNADLSRLGTEITKLGLVDTDVAISGGMAARACEAAGMSNLARKAWEIVHRQFMALGRTEEAQEVAEKLNLTEAD
jgi:tetratricopeptide (TPR) repeat protein